MGVTCAFGIGWFGSLEPFGSFESFEEHESANGPNVPTNDS